MKTMTKEQIKDIEDTLKEASRLITGASIKMEGCGLTGPILDELFSMPITLNSDIEELAIENKITVE